MNPPSAESVWATVAGCSKCTCLCQTRPCLRCHREAAEAYWAALGRACTRVTKIPRGNQPRSVTGFFMYEILPGMGLSEIHSWHGIPSAVMYHDELWSSQRNTAAYETLVELLKHMGNFQ